MTLCTIIQSFKNPQNDNLSLEIENKITYKFMNQLINVF